ncbi:MAG TPA: hypothetical protein GX716_02840, partial [Firmicutes bacterium]|nr:hypothetical protein [Candidatus Fermentithermobacillaceae bacterium]
MSVPLQELIRRAREEAQRQALTGLRSPSPAPTLPIAEMQATLRAYSQAHEAARRLAEMQMPQPTSRTGVRSLLSRGEGIGLLDPIQPQELKGLRPEAQKALEGMTFEELSMTLHQLTPLQREAAASQTAGWGDVLSTIGGAISWKGADAARVAGAVASVAGRKEIGRLIAEQAPAMGEVGKKITERAAELQARAPQDVPELTSTWKDYFNPRFWTTKVARSVPFTLALLPIGLLGSYAAGAVGLTGAVAKGAAALGAKAAGMGTFGKAVVGKLAQYLAGAGTSMGAGALSGLAESAMEAGGTYNEAIAMGYSAEEADTMADETFKKNLALLPMTETLEWMTGVAKVPGLDKIMETGIGKVAAPMVRVGLTGVMEAAEEAYQEWAQATSLGKEFSLSSPEAREAMMVGFAMGGGQSMIGVARDVASMTVTKTMENLSPETRAQVEESVAEKVKTGQPQEQALIEALDEVAETEEGRQAIETAVQEVVQEQRQVAGLPETPPVPEVPKVEIKVPTKGPRAAFQVGQVVYHPTTGAALTITDASDPALLVTQNAEGTTVKIGKGAVVLEPPSTDAQRTEAEVQKPPAVAPQVTPPVVSPPTKGISPQAAEIALPEASEGISGKQPDAIRSKVPDEPSFTKFGLGPAVKFSNPAYLRLYAFGENIVDDYLEWETQPIIDRLANELDLPEGASVWNAARAYFERINAEAKEHAKTNRDVPYEAGPLLKSDVRMSPESSVVPVTPKGGDADATETTERTGDREAGTGRTAIKTIRPRPSTDIFTAPSGFRYTKGFREDAQKIVDGVMGELPTPIQEFAKQNSYFFWAADLFEGRPLDEQHALMLQLADAAVVTVRLDNGLSAIGIMGNHPIEADNIVHELGHVHFNRIAPEQRAALIAEYEPVGDKLMAAIQKDSKWQKVYGRIVDMMRDKPQGVLNIINGQIRLMESEIATLGKSLDAGDYYPYFYEYLLFDRAMRQVGMEKFSPEHILTVQSELFCYDINRDHDVLAKALKEFATQEPEPTSIPGEEQPLRVAPEPKAEEKLSETASAAKPVKGVVIENRNQNGVEIRFAAKPDESVLNTLRDSGFKWNGKRKVWYKKGL